MQKGEGSRRLGNQRHAKEAGNWVEVGLSRSVRPILGPSRPPFDLGAYQAIYSPLTESHTTIHLSSAVEEQRREGHRSGEERVEMVD
jgi:hypothetical protein